MVQRSHPFVQAGSMELSQGRSPVNFCLVFIPRGTLLSAYLIQNLGTYPDPNMNSCRESPPKLILRALFLLCSRSLFWIAFDSTSDWRVLKLWSFAGFASFAISKTPVGFKPIQGQALEPQVLFALTSCPENTGHTGSLGFQLSSGISQALLFSKYFFPQHHLNEGTAPILFRSFHPLWFLTYYQCRFSKRFWRKLTPCL